MKTAKIVLKSPALRQRLLSSLQLLRFVWGTHKELSEHCVEKVHVHRPNEMKLATIERMLIEVAK